MHKYIYVIKNKLALSNQLITINRNQNKSLLHNIL